MARGIAKLGDLLDRVKNVSRNLTQNLTQNLTKEKVKSELAWMSGNAVICGAAKILTGAIITSASSTALVAKALTAATLVTATPAIATAAGIVVGGVLLTSIRHIKEQVDVDAKKDGNTDSRLKLAIRHLNRAEIWDHMKTSQFRTRLLLNWGVSLGTFGLLEGTDIGQKVAEHAGKAIQKTAHWLSGRANAVCSMLKNAVNLNAKSVMPIQSALAMPAPAPVPNAVVVDAPPTPAAPSAAVPPPKMGAPALIAEKDLRTPQQIKDYAYTLLNGKNGVTADPKTAIELYKISATAGNKQAIENLRFLASQKQYKGFGLTEYLKSHPTPVAHSPTTGTAGAKSLAPTKPSRIHMEFPAPKPINPAAAIPVPAADPYDLSAYFRDETPEPPSAPRVVMKCTTGLNLETIKTLDKTQPLIPDCDVRTNLTHAGDLLEIDDNQYYYDGKKPVYTLNWAGRIAEEFTARKAGYLRAITEKLFTAAPPSPAPVNIARVTPPESWLVHNIQ